MEYILDWSEVWALLPPLFLLALRRKQPAYLKPVIVWLWIALVLNITIDTIMGFKQYLPNWLQSNNPLYNVQSLVRFVCFSMFFMRLPQEHFKAFRHWLVVLFSLFVIINFAYFENFLEYMHLSGNLLATEAYLLLIFCMQYYLAELKKDADEISGGADFWVVTGLSIYVVSNFFIFLFYIPLLDVNPQLSVNMWNVHNIAFIILCIFITKAIYGPVRYKLAV